MIDVADTPLRVEPGVGLTQEQQHFISSPAWGPTLGFIYFGAMRAWVHVGVIVVSSLIPFASIFVLVFYALKGREIAWHARTWGSFEEFEKTQRYWDKYAKTLTLVGVVIFSLLMGWLIWFLSVNLDTLLPAASILSPSL